MKRLTKDSLLTSIKVGHEKLIENYDKRFQEWKNSIKPEHAFGYCPFMVPITCAYTEAFLYQLEGNEEHAKLAREHLVNFRQFTKYYPKDYHKTRPEFENGLPPLPNMFTLWQFSKAYLWIRKSQQLAVSDHKTIELLAADSMPFIFYFPEWGAHNRTVLRALSLAMAAQAFPENPAANDWRQMARVLAGDSLNHWNIEDAMLYHGVWIHALIWYADTFKPIDLFKTTAAKYYFEYFKQLLAPSGALADFGDSNWQSNLMLYMAGFARAAKEYQDPEMAFAAETVFNTLHQASGSLPFSDVLISAYLWLDDSIEPKKPSNGSRDVLDELVGKKIVFRNGWENDSTFLLLNYKPESDFGYTQREYLKNTISVEAEKAHHGHSDENSICLFMHNQSVLLHDGGYREELPNGKYRADYYHNRIVFREKELLPGSPIMDFLKYDGKHQPVETQKIDFQTFDDFEMSRTRVTDRNHGYCWDRSISYLKDRDWFVIFDGFTLLENPTANKKRLISLSNLFFTRQILSQGNGYFDTRIDKLQAIDIPDNSRLLICFPQAGQENFWTGSQQTQRYYQDEIALHQSLSKSVMPQEYIAFITVLIPHTGEADIQKLMQSITIPQVSFYPRAAALEISDESEKLTIGVKLDLESEILKENVRPRYSWDSGKTTYGAVETDARYFYCKEKQGQLTYAFTEAVRLNYGGKKIFAAKPMAFGLQYVGDDSQNGIAKWRAWEGSAKLG